MKDLKDILLEYEGTDIEGNPRYLLSSVISILEEFGENIKHIEQFPTEEDNNFPVTQYIDFQLIKVKSILK